LTVEFPYSHDTTIFAGKIHYFANNINAKAHNTQQDEFCKLILRMTFLLKLIFVHFRMVVLNQRNTLPCVTHHWTWNLNLRNTQAPVFVQTLMPFSITRSIGKTHRCDYPHWQSQSAQNAESFFFNITTYTVTMTILIGIFIMLTTGISIARRILCSSQI